MFTGEIVNLPLEVQIALGGGFLAYSTAYAGLRRGHSATDVTMISLAFGLIGIVVFRGLAPYLMDGWRVGAAVAGMLVVGALWRAKGRDLARRVLRIAQVHQDDGLVSGWDALIQTPGLRVTQIRVVLTSGDDLFCENVSAYAHAVQKGILLGSDGSIAMVVDSEEVGGAVEDRRDQIGLPDWGTRVTYIPADKISRVELRCL